MSIDEARCAVVNAARAVRQSGMVDVRLDALYGALDALDAVGEPDYRAARGCLPWQPGMPSPEEAIRRGRDADEGPPGICAAADCWRGPIVPGGVCHFHSPYAALPSLRRRDAAFQGVQDGE